MKIKKLIPLFTLFAMGCSSQASLESESISSAYDSHIDSLARSSTTSGNWEGFVCTEYVRQEDFYCDSFVMAPMYGVDLRRSVQITFGETYSFSYKSPNDSGHLNTPYAEHEILAWGFAGFGGGSLNSHTPQVDIAVFLTVQESVIIVLSHSLLATPKIRELDFLEPGHIEEFDIESTHNGKALKINAAIRLSDIIRDS